MHETEELVVLPASSLPSAIDGGLMASPSPSLSRHHGHHASSSTKSDHFRRLEDRMDQLHDQILATQRLVLELTKRLDPEMAPGPHRSTSRLTFRTVSGKALQSARSGVPPGVGPSASLPMAVSFLSTMAPATAASSKKRNSMEHILANHDHEPVGETRDDATDNMAVRRASHTDRVVPSQTRKHSATNPVALLPSSKRESRPMVSMAVAHAATSIAESANTTSTKKMPITETATPIRGRRFSISALDVAASPPPRPTPVNRVVKWSRNLFSPRLASVVVSPEEIQDARREHARLHRFAIRHDSLQRMVWDSVVMLMIIVDVVVTPLSLSFRFFPHGISTYNAVGNLIFGTDFAVHLLSSYTTPRGDLVSNPQSTMSHYLTSPWALADFLSWFPFDVLVASEQGRFLGVAKVIRLAKVSQLARRLHSARKAGFFRFVKLLGIVFIVSHCLSCYWNWVAVDWRVTEDGYTTMTIGEQYAHCWSLVIGSLNASPPAMHSTTEEVSVAIFMLIGNVLQATVFGSVAVLIQSFDEDEVAYNKKLISTYERCRFLDIPETLARRIQGYYENLYRETRSVDPDADAFINELSPALICEVKFQLYRDMIKQIPFLSATHINPVVIEMLILHLRTVIYMQDDVLIRKGEVGDWMGFIGSKGSVGVLDPNADFRKIIRILKKGDYFGEMALLQRAKRSTTAIALTWVQIHVLCRNDLDDVKDQYPEQAEILEQEIHKYMQTKVTYK